ncbi:MAG: Hsp20/alpha crystallin family protein [bacterium]
MAIQRRRSPFRNLLDLERELGDIFPWREEEEDETTLSAWSPRVDIYEEGDSLVFECEAPGVNKEDIDVSVENNRLTITGERREEKTVQEEDRNYYRTEQRFGTFQRAFALPDTVDTEQISATYDNGVLKVTVPEGAQSGRESIEIE